jgi:hypothetical protein
MTIDKQDYNDKTNSDIASYTGKAHICIIHLIPFSSKKCIPKTKEQKHYIINPIVDRMVPTHQR